MADAPTAPLEDTTMQQSAPDAGTELHAAEPAPAPAGSTAEAYEPGQKVDTMGRLTGPSAPDTQANGGANGSQSADSEDLDDDADEAGADAAGDNRPSGAAPPVSSVDPPSSSKPAGVADAHGHEDEPDEDGDAAAKHADSDGDLMANGAGSGRDDDEDAEMEEAEVEGTTVQPTRQAVHIIPVSAAGCSLQSTWVSAGILNQAPCWIKYQVLYLPQDNGDKAYPAHGGIADMQTCPVNNMRFASWVSHDAVRELSCMYTAKAQQHRARAARQCLSDTWVMSSLWLLCTVTAELPAIMSADYQGKFRSAYLLT